MPRYRRAVLGGTFDQFHVGHAALLARAFYVGRDVSIGLTTAEFLREHPKPYPRRIQPYSVRRRSLVRWIRAHYPGRAFRVVPLANPFGRSTEPGFDVLVVSADTRAGGRAVNAERRRLGRPQLPIDVVPVVLADDLEPVSSRRIRAGEIDRRGHRTARSIVAYGVTEDADERAVRGAIRTAFPRAAIRSIPSAGSRRASGNAAWIREFGRRAIAGADLAVVVARRPQGGWLALERSRSLELGPRPIARGSRAQLQGALRTLLRPGRAARTDR